MRKTSHVSDILQCRGFWLHKIVGRLLGIGFLGQCLVVSTICAVTILLASTADHSLFLPGRDVGLLEHPAIWGFLILQTVIPIALARSIAQLGHTTLENGAISTRTENSLDENEKISGRADRDSDLIIPAVRRFLQLKDRESQLAATFVYCAGLAAWAWNTYQNQFPGIIVPYDFWDSTTFLWGYTITRIHKLYLFVVLLPYLAMIHIGILVATLRLVRQSRLSGKLKLLPFHPDGHGGLGFVAGLISKPIILTLVIGTATTAGAFLIHRAANITPVLGLSMLLSWALLTYIGPILFLRADIVALKQQMITKLRSLQQADYSKVFENGGSEFRVLRKEKEALEYFDKVCERVQSISNYPHWKRLIGFAGLAAAPSLIGVLFNALVAFIRH